MRGMPAGAQVAGVLGRLICIGMWLVELKFAAGVISAGHASMAAVEENRAKVRALCDGAWHCLRADHEAGGPRVKSGKECWFVILAMDELGRDLDALHRSILRHSLLIEAVWALVALLAIMANFCYALDIVLLGFSTVLVVACIVVYVPVGVFV